MLLIPPLAGDPPPVPSISRPLNSSGVGGLTQPDFASSNALMAQMPDALRTQFGNRHIGRPSGLTDNTGSSNLGTYGNGQVRVDRSTDDPAVLRHELLHALSVEHPRFHDEPYFYFGRLANAIKQSGPLSPTVAPWVQPQDMAHTFVHLGELAMDQPDALPLPLQTYFAPLLPPIQSPHGAR